MSEFTRIKGVPSDYIGDICLLPTVNQLAVCSWDGTLTLFDLEQGSPLMKLKYDDPLICCHVAEDNKIWVGSVQGKLLEADWESEKLIERRSVVTDLAISSIVSYGKLLVLASWDGSVLIFDPLKDNVVTSWKFKEKIYHMCASETVIVCSMSGGRIKLIHLPSLDVTDRDSGLKCQCKSSAIIPNNLGFVQASIDGRVSVEFFEDESRKFAFRCHRMNLEDVQLVFPVNSLAFKPNSMHLFTGGADGKVVGWNLSTRKKQEEFSKLNDSIVKLCCTDDYLVIATSDDSFKTCAVPENIKLNASAIYIKHF